MVFQRRIRRGRVLGIDPRELAEHAARTAGVAFKQNFTPDYAAKLAKSAFQAGVNLVKRKLGGRRAQGIYKRQTKRGRNIRYQGKRRARSLWSNPYETRYGGILR